MTVNTYYAALAAEQQNQQARRQRELDEQFDVLARSADPALDPNLKALAAKDPRRVQAILEASRAPDVFRLNNMLNNAKEIEYMAATGRESDIAPFLQQNIQEITARGGDPMHSMGALQAYQQGGMDGLNREIQAFKSVFDPNFKPAQEKTTANINDMLFYDKLVASGDMERAEMFANKAGISKLSPQEQASLRLETEALSSAAKKRIDRDYKKIEAADQSVAALGTTTRMLDLLKEGVDTGRFDGAELFLRNTFGMDAEDEAELSYLMGTSMMQQLRPLFGSAFTATEVKMFENIAPKFSRTNAKNNIRLIERMQQTALSGLKSGLKSARRVKDDLAIEQYENAIANMGRLEGEKKEKDDEFSGFSIAN